MKIRFFTTFILLVIVTISGCSGNSENQEREIEYRYCTETRRKQLEFRATLKPSDVENVSIKSGHGTIEWMADEGEKVASGATVVKIDMGAIETRVRRSEKNIASQLDLFEKVRSANPAEEADLKMNLHSRKLDFERAGSERKWLFNPKNDGEVWKINSDLEAAEINFDLAAKLYGLKKKLTEKGFDSAFSLRSSEIDKRSREIEKEYAARLVKQLSQAPLTEELAQIDFQKTVASGEIWLAQNKIVSASVSAQIREKSMEVVLERFRSNFRDNKKTLDEAVKFAPRDGVVVHPFLWGDFKFRVGQSVWPGVSILQVVIEGRYYLEALLHENILNGMTEKASATIRLDSCPDRVFSGQVKSISKAPKNIRGLRNSGLKFIPVEISLDADEKLIPGDKADVTVDLGEFTGVFLPRDLVKRVGDKNLLVQKTLFGREEIIVELEDFNQDWVFWKNPHQEQGVLFFP